MTRGWYDESRRHSLAAKGVRTAVPPARGSVAVGEIHHGNLTVFLTAYEMGELDDWETLRLFGYLVRTGRAWELAPHYASTASNLVDAGFLDGRGRILASMEDLAASGIPKGDLQYFRDMAKDEELGVQRYREMAGRYPEYGWLFEKMAEDERRHMVLIRKMERGERIDIRGVIKRDVRDVLGALEKAGKITALNRREVETGAGRVIDSMEVEELKASGLEVALVTGFLGAVGSKFAERAMDGSSSPS